MPQGHLVVDVIFSSFVYSISQNLDVMNEAVEDSKNEPPPAPPSIPTQTIVEDSIASRTKEITKRPKRERSPSSSKSNLCCSSAARVFV